MYMKFDARLFEDLSSHLKMLGRQFGSEVPRTKDEKVQMVLDEARLYTFLLCHNTFINLLRSMYEQSPFSKKEGSDPKNAVGEVLIELVKENAFTKKEAEIFVEQFNSAKHLFYDTAWFDDPKDQKLFLGEMKKISRYYYAMSTFLSYLTKHLAIIPPEAKNAATQ